MSHKRLTIFLGVLLALLIVPTTLPYILGHLILPWWAFVFYAIIILVNAGIYLIQRCLLIDRFFVQGRIGIARSAPVSRQRCTMPADRNLPV